MHLLSIKSSRSGLPRASSRMELNAYQAEQIMILQGEVEALQTVLSQLATLCEDLQSQINQK